MASKVLMVMRLVILSPPNVSLTARCSAKKSRVEVMSTLLNVQHVIHELLVVPVALCQIDLIGIDDQKGAAS
jgi:hypothetical protein